MLPLARRPRAGAALPGQPRAAGPPAQRDRHPRRRASAPSRVVLARLRGLAAAILPALARRALHVVTVSEFSRGELVELLRRRAEVTVIPGGVDERFTPAPTRERRGARSASTRPTCSASPPTPRARTPAGARPARPRRRGRRRGRPPPAVRARGRARRCGCSAPSPTRCSPACTRAPRRSCCRASTRASAARARGDGVRHAGRRVGHAALPETARRRGARSSRPATWRSAAALLGDEDDRARLRARGPAAGGGLHLGPHRARGRRAAQRSSRRAAAR